MIYHRAIFDKVEKYIDDDEIIVVTGMRRVGKTTLLQYFFDQIKSENKLFMDLEDPLNRSIFDLEGYENIKTEFARRGVDFSQKAHIFLDEIQFVSSLPSVVKYFYDHYDVKFFLTGSASFYLKNLFSESLAGRKVLFEMFPLTFEEILRFEESNYQLPAFNENVSKETFSLFQPLVDDYLEYGGMPGVVLKENTKKKVAQLRDIFTSYFQKEVATLGGFRKNKAVKNLISLLSRRVGQRVDIQKISKELGVSRPTVYDYLEFLEASYFITLLSAYGSVDTSVRKQKKAYFIDPGFFSILERPATGAAFESAVYSQLRLVGDVSYYQKNGKEVDFVLRRDGAEIAFEVKETATESDLRKLERRSGDLGIEKYFLLSKNFSDVERVRYLFQIGSICKNA